MNFYISRGVKETIPIKEVQDAFLRYEKEDWGDLCKEDIQANKDAKITGARIIGVYRTVSGDKFYIITEPNRVVTTVVLVEEY